MEAGIGMDSASGFNSISDIKDFGVLPPDVLEV